MNDGTRQPVAAGPLDLSLRRQRGDEILIEVVAQGAVRVNMAFVDRDYGDCVLVYVDLNSKRAVLDCFVESHERGPRVYLSADENTLHLDETQPRDAATCIEFREFPRWRVFCVSGPSRYTMALALVAPEA